MRSSDVHSTPSVCLTSAPPPCNKFSLYYGRLFIFNGYEYPPFYYGRKLQDVFGLHWVASGVLDGYLRRVPDPSDLMCKFLLAWLRRAIIHNKRTNISDTTYAIFGNADINGKIIYGNLNMSSSIVWKKYLLCTRLIQFGYVPDPADSLLYTLWISSVHFRYVASKNIIGYCVERCFLLWSTPIQFAISIFP